MSRASGARLIEAVVKAQPHRAPFYRLIGETAAGDWRCESALGRLRMVGEAVEKRTDAYVARVLYGSSHPVVGPFGITERQFQAGLKYAEIIARERWVRAAPKDKPSAVAFMVARGIDLSARELRPAEAKAYLQAFEDMRAALLAATLPADARRVLGRMRAIARREHSDDVLRMARGFGSLVNPAVAGAITAAVNHCVIDDRDPPRHELALVRRGLDALAEHAFGAADPERRPITGYGERPEWQHEVHEIAILYEDVERRIDPASGRIADEARSAPRSARQEPKRRLHPFHADRS
jgi:hypothetical protein